MDGKSKLADIAYQKGQLIGQYKILEVLKQGQFTDTFLGREIEGKIPVMIKVLRPPLISELENDFLTQARVLMEMRHPHILRILDVGMDNHNPFLVTKYVSHVTLRQLFPRGSVQSLTAFLPYIKQIASALQYAHDRHVLHGDLRLRNVLLNTDNQILLTDFTIETILQNRTRLNYKHDDSIVYSAPERIQGKPLPASDQYSLGIIVYKLLSGEPPSLPDTF